jgi:hypothetical protein
LHSDNLTDSEKLEWFDKNIEKIKLLTPTFSRKSKEPITFFNLSLHIKQYYENPNMVFNFSIILDINSSSILHIGCLLREFKFVKKLHNNPIIKFQFYEYIRDLWILITEGKYGLLDNFSYDSLKMFTLIIINNMYKKLPFNTYFQKEFKWLKDLKQFTYIDKNKNSHFLSHQDIRDIENCLIKVTYESIHNLDFFHLTINNILEIAHHFNSPISWNTT